MASSDSPALAHERRLSAADWATLLLVAATPLAITYFELLPPETFWQHHPFHAVVEGLGSFAALIVAAAMVILTRQEHLPPPYRWVICGLIGMGMLDGFHAATHAGLVFVWLHSTATFVGGFLFACVWLPSAVHRATPVVFLACFTLGLAAAFGGGSIAFPGLLPAMQTEEGFTFIAKALNVGGGVGFLLAAAFFVLRYGKTWNGLLFANLSLLFGVAGIIFEQSALWDGNWWLWHLLRLAAYGVVLYFFLKLYYRNLHDLHDAQSSLRSRVEDLSRHDEEIRHAHGQLETILNSTADAIIAVGEDGRVQSFNSKAEQLFGYGRQAVIGRNVSMLMPSPHREQHDGYIARYLRTGEARIINGERELEAVRRDGALFPISLKVTEMQYGDARLFIGVVQDISARRHAEQERRRLFDALRETVSHLSAASTQISATMVQQMRGTEKQAEAVSHTVAAVVETLRAAEESEHLARDVAATAHNAETVGRSGREAIEETRVSMNTVQGHVTSTAENVVTLVERAQAIGEIIAAVNDIAEQTNVLALNAAIEASRAGQSGKGFAVVAAEVKSLAEQAKNATAQVRRILGDIRRATSNAVESSELGTRSVEEATSIVARTEQTVESLGKMVSEAAQAATKIAAASAQQATSMSQISKSMSEIDLTARQTLAATRQTEQAAEDLNALGNRLRELLTGNRQLEVHQQPVPR